MKKTLCLVLVGLLMLSLAWVSHAEGPVKVGVCIYKYDDYFMTLYRAELEKYLAEKGCAVTIVDGKGDQSKQTDQIITFIAEGVDVLIVNLVQVSAADSVIGLAREADVPVVFINREPSPDDMELWDRICYVGVDTRQSGTYAGEIITQTENQGDWNGNGIVECVSIIGDPESIDVHYRKDYMIEALRDAGLAVEVLLVKRANWDLRQGQEVAAEALAEFGERIDVIFCSNDAMALGALEAINEAGRQVGKDIYLVGVDALYEVMEQIKAENFTGTILNDHIGQAHQAADAALLASAGEMPEKYYIVDFIKITEKNVGEFYPW